MENKPRKSSISVMALIKNTKGQILGIIKRVEGTKEWFINGERQTEA